MTMYMPRVRLITGTGLEFELYGDEARSAFAQAGFNDLGRTSGPTPVEAIRERIAKLRAITYQPSSFNDGASEARALDDREIEGLEFALRALGVEP